MSEGPIRICLIGYGRIARLIHLPVLSGLPGVRVVAVVEPDGEARAAAGAAASGAALYASLEEMLAGTVVDAVVVCAPTGTHADIARASFAAGCAVYLEKPVAATLADGRTVAEAQRAAGTIGMTGFMLRFSPAFAEARALLASDAIGEIVGVQSVFTACPDDAPAWKHDRASGGGALLDLLSHHADLVRWLLCTDLVAVEAHVRSLRTEDDTASVRMQTASGAAVQTLVSTSSAEDHRVEVVGATGRLAIDPWRMATPEVFGTSGGTSRTDRIRRLGPRRLLHRPDYREPFHGALAAFCHAVRTGRPVRPDLTDGLVSLAVVEAAERAARSGTVERVEATDVVPVSAGRDRP